MKPKWNLELLGLSLEIVGLLLALGAALYQAVVTDWFSNYHRDAIALAQGSSTIDTMASLQLLSRQLNEADANVRRQINDDLHERTGRVIRAVIEDREQRTNVARGQQSSYGSVRLYLFGVGALFVVLGKWLVLLHKSAAVNLTPKREADTQGLRGAIRRSRWPRTANPTKWRRR